MSKNKICIVSVFFGNLPDYFLYWKKSCLFNEKIDFLFITDNDVLSEDNFNSLKMSFSDFKSLAKEKLKIEITLNTPYKLCDYKPVWGLILKSYLEGYDYWGHCDIDLIFGDLSYFFDKYNLYNYDKFLPLGHLCLYRNNEDVLSRYKLQCNIDNPYDKTFNTDEITVFDEYQGINEIYNQYGFKKFNGRIFADICQIHKRCRFAVRTPNDIDYKQEIFYFENGKTKIDFFENNKLKTKEVIYIHFQKRNIPVNDNAQIPEAYYITNFGFIPKTGETTLEIIKKYNPYKNKLYEDFEEFRFYFKKKLGFLKRRMSKVFRRTSQ